MRTASCVDATHVSFMRPYCLPHTSPGDCQPTGPPLQPYMPYNIGGPGTCRVESPTAVMLCDSTNSSGITPPEQLIPLRRDLSTTPIQPGEQAIWQTVSTGKFCRVLLEAGQSRVVCDVDNLAQAAPLAYTGAGGCISAAAVLARLCGLLVSTDVLVLTC